jgi:methylthioribose-1-phosphate isomerase
MIRLITSYHDVPTLRQALIAEAVAIHRTEAEFSQSISQFGADLVPDGSTVLTHCNTGPLATTGFGTAFGVIAFAAAAGKQVRVLVDETRPLLQGARLTAWELKKAGIPYTLITDSMAAYFMRNKRVDLAIVGADCIAANGDTANKIGTYGVACLCKLHKIPFYVAAPSSTVDLSKRTGEDIVVEERSAEEVTAFHGIPVAPEGSSVANPAFDVTPAGYINAFVTEHGILTPPYRARLRSLPR